MAGIAHWMSFQPPSGFASYCQVTARRGLFAQVRSWREIAERHSNSPRTLFKRPGSSSVGEAGDDLRQYDDLFFDYVDSGAIRSAEIFTKLLMPELQANSLLDVGCGRGGWASRWKAAGMATILGVDGDYVDRSRMYIAPHEFQVVDLNLPFRLDRRFDLVQSLEVAEHLRPESSRSFVESLVAHGDIVLFSAAVLGQGGTQHINERPIQFWRSLFAEHGYRSYDFIRPLTRANAEVEPWYRYNSIVYVNAIGAQRISEAVRRTEIPMGFSIPEMAPPAWRIRRGVLKHMPCALVDTLAMINAKLRVGFSHKR